MSGIMGRWLAVTTLALAAVMASAGAQAVEFNELPMSVQLSVRGAAEHSNEALHGVIDRLIHQYPEHKDEIIALAQTYRPDFQMPLSPETAGQLTSRPATMTPGAVATDAQAPANGAPAPVAAPVITTPLPGTDPAASTSPPLPLPLTPVPAAAAPATAARVRTAARTAAPALNQPRTTGPGESMGRLVTPDDKIGLTVIPPGTGQRPMVENMSALETEPATYTEFLHGQRVVTNLYAPPPIDPLARGFDVTNGRNWDLPISVQLTLTGVSTARDIVFLDGVRKLCLRNTDVASRIVAEAKFLRPELVDQIDIYTPKPEPDQRPKEAAETE